MSAKNGKRKTDQKIAVVLFDKNQISTTALPGMVQISLQAYVTATIFWQ